VNVFQLPLPVRFVPAIPAVAYLPEALVLGAALLIFLLDALGIRRIEVFGGIAIAGILSSLGIVLGDLGFSPLTLFATVPASTVDLPMGSEGLVAFTTLGMVFQGIFLTSAFLVALASLSRDRYERGSAVFYGLLLIATLGMLLLALSADLIFLLISVEITAVASYLLVGYSRGEPRHLEAAMKFYIIGALSAALSFFGASLLYGAYGSTSLAVLGRAAVSGAFPGLALLGYGFLIVGLGFEVTAVPFHMWAVDVYDGAPTDVSAFLAGGTKKSGLLAFFLVFLPPTILVSVIVRAPVCGLGPPACLSPASPDLRVAIPLALSILSILTMTVGNVLALLQREMKRMLAYSSISQAGYMLIGVAVGTPAALAGATLQIFAHVFLKAGAFLVVAGFASLGVGPLIEDWRGLGLRRPYSSAAFAVMLLGLAGIPLTVGFVSKFILFSAAIRAQGFFVWLAVAGLLNSALSVFYYARVLRVMYLDRAEPRPVPALGSAPVVGGSEPPALAFGGLGWGRSAAIFIATMAIFAFGVDPQPVLQAFYSGAVHFFGLFG
jgi:NADH:ubiquinone oxidoreductase subunit 2 (subunit N)